MFNTFYQYIHRFKEAVNVYIEAVKYNAINLVKKGDYISYQLQVNEGMSKALIAALLALKKHENKADHDEAFLYYKVFKEGPKVFKPTTQQLALLEQMTLNVEIANYVQPFQTMIIDLPEGYYKDRSAICPQAGSVHHGETMPEKHDPRFAIIHHDPQLKVLVTGVFYSSGFSINTCLTFKHSEVIEDTLGLSKIKTYEDSLEMNEDEETINWNVLRACLNYCLLLDEIGIKRVGPENEKYYNKLNEYRQKATKRGDIDQAKKNMAEINKHPIVYTLLNQDVKLHRTVKSHSELPAEPTGRTVKPHHRLGYYRNQHYGPGNTLIKRVRIPPVFVNKYLFVGDMIDARATYTS